VVVEGAQLVCDCPAAQHGRVCAHRAATRARLEEERQATRQATREQERASRGTSRESGGCGETAILARPSARPFSIFKAEE